MSVQDVLIDIYDKRPQALLPTKAQMTGFLSYIKQNKLHFLTDHKETIILLSRLGKREFEVHCPMSPVPEDISSQVGTVISFKVDISYYSFKSRSKHNQGEHISGYKLTLTEIL